MFLAFLSAVEMLSPQSIQNLFKSMGFGSLSSAAMADKQNKLLSAVIQPKYLQPLSKKKKKEKKSLALGHCKEFTEVFVSAVFRF